MRLADFLLLRRRERRRPPFIAFASSKSFCASSFFAGSSPASSIAFLAASNAACFSSEIGDDGDADMEASSATVSDTGVGVDTFSAAAAGDASGTLSANRSIPFDTVFNAAFILSSSSLSYTYSQYFILPILRINSTTFFQRRLVERDFFLNTRLADFLYLREGRRPLPLKYGPHSA